MRQTVLLLYAALSVLGTAVAFVHVGSSVLIHSQETLYPRTQGDEQFGTRLFLLFLATAFLTHVPSLQALLLPSTRIIL